ncbi:hypothetical protein EGR_02412 [Echinococcus granulosus]|uniref:Uncharacterized protein n=1 Tax=Echinococcus granulosus TaxID=6210 RepID=W6UPC0_ECHGR|nr:hypothetical protein EGR_02412 [Echinococcus granulosus]EUB62616.1 hypothetical protein EGR_02412 [Echinococcus granulosus]
MASFSSFLRPNYKNYQLHKFHLFIETNLTIISDRRLSLLSQGQMLFKYFLVNTVEVTSFLNEILLIKDLKVLLLQANWLNFCRFLSTKPFLATSTRRNAHRIFSIPREKLRISHAEVYGGSVKQP